MPLTSAPQRRTGPRDASNPPGISAQSLRVAGDLYVNRRQEPRKWPPHTPRPPEKLVPGLLRTLTAPGPIRVAQHFQGLLDPPRASPASWRLRRRVRVIVSRGRLPPSAATTSGGTSSPSWAPAARRRHETSRAAPLIWVDSGERVVGVDPRVGRQRVGGAQRLVPGALLWAVRQVVVVRAGVAALLDAASAVDAR
jgi:hypothetical protein